MDVKINEDWKHLLKQEFEKDYFIDLVNFLHKEKKENKTIYPPGSLIFNAFNITPPSDIKVVILGQDPYHGPSQAHGLSFSVPTGIKIPPSLKNIYKEIQTDLNISVAKDGNLENWAKQGVFLLNASLIVEDGKPASHSKIGWTIFTDNVIKALSDNYQNLVFMLWGNYAKNKSELINHSKHLDLEAAHPSPLARGAFFECKHFSKCNSYLEENAIKPINWAL